MAGRRRVLHRGQRQDGAHGQLRQRRARHLPRLVLLKLAVLVIGSLAAALASGVAQAAEPPKPAPAHPSPPNPRVDRKIGLWAGTLTEPYLSLYGFGAGYNVLPFLRPSVSIGFTDLTQGSFRVQATSFAFEALFVHPEWAISPAVQLGYAHMNVTLTGTGSSSLYGSRGSGGTMTIGLGVDWQTAGGFALGAEYKIPFVGGDGRPGLRLGWFF